MTLPKPKFEIGETVFYASSRVEKRYVECPDCKGTDRWKVVTEGGEFEIRCQTCSGYMNSHRVYETEGIPEVSNLTIGSVKIDTGDECPVKYMCNETGVGSGRVYDETELFTFHTKATEVADRMAKEHESKVVKNRGTTDLDLRINRMEIVSATIADKERDVQKRTENFRRWGYFLQDFQTDEIEGEVNISQEDLYAVVEAIQVKFDEFKSNQKELERQTTHGD